MDGLFTSSSKKKKLKAKKALDLKMANKETVATEELAKQMVVEKEKAIVEVKEGIKKSLRDNGFYIVVGLAAVFMGYKIFIKNRKR